MEDLFDLNDFEEKDSQINSTTDNTNSESKELSTENHPEEQLKVDKKDIIEKEEKNGTVQINDEKSVNNIDNNLNTIFSSEKKLPELEKQYAIEDDISITSFNDIKEPALTYPFELDEFQKRSIIRLEQHENVLVCAHTSSGKTVVAEYGIALGKKKKRRVLYTSPIKALSNQKYREFKKIFQDVGILTGDVTINPTAQCVIMTTEVLQNYLYKNSELLASVEWVVFDEVHYINDNERGHVWEEILILLPKNIGIIMLSATIPNYLEFAQWVGRIKNTTIYVQNTVKRVVPLQHMLFVNWKNVFIAKDKDNNVYDNNVRNAIKCAALWKNNLKMMEKQPQYYNAKKGKEMLYLNNIQRFNKIKGRKNKKDFLRITNMHFKIEEIVSYLAHEQKTPAVIFVFSIKRINEYAKMLSSIQLTNRQEQYYIQTFFDQCMSVLPIEDRNIPQLDEMREVLKSGIGVHHSGLLPILKETIELLYSKGLIKILFATTSFSIGLNMPTRTVVFTEIYKFNDEKKEILSSSEYLQMCGRAGRRGIDTIGNVYILLGERTQDSDSTDIIGMLKGKGTQVESKFRLCYRTIIAFLSRNIIDINDFFKESFLENLNIKEIPKIQQEIADMKKNLSDIEDIHCQYTNDESEMNKFIHLTEQMMRNNEILFSCQSIRNKIKKGCLLKVRDMETQNDIIVMVVHFYSNNGGMIWCIKAEKNKEPTKNRIKNKKDKYDFDVKDTKGILDDIYYEYMMYLIRDIIDVYKTRIECNFDDVIKDENNYIYLSKEILSRCILDVLYYNIDIKSYMMLKQRNYKKLINKDMDYMNCLQRKNEINQAISLSKCYSCPLKEEHAKHFLNKMKIQYEISEREKALNPENMAHYNEFHTRNKILHLLQYIDDKEVLTLKGKAAREISTTDCVLITELLMSNILNILKDEEIVAFLSGFANNKNEIEFNDPKISKEFSVAFEAFYKIYMQLVMMESQINSFEENKYNRRITFAVSRAMKSWMMNYTFSEILKETDLEEGKLYNLILRIYLFIDEIINFYNIIGNVKLSERYKRIKEKLLRGVMSTRSLYLQDNINID